MALKYHIDLHNEIMCFEKIQINLVSITNDFRKTRIPIKTKGFQ